MVAWILQAVRVRVAKEVRAAAECPQGLSAWRNNNLERERADVSANQTVKI